MCDEYAKLDNRIKIIHKANAGLGCARNSGMEIATGEYVAFVDSDDFVDVRMYETLYMTAKKNSLDTCYCGFNYYNGSNDTSRERCEVEDTVIFKGRKEVGNFMLEMIGPSLTYPHEVKYLMCVWKAIYSMALINKYGLRFDNEKEIASEDILFHSLYLSKALAVGFVPFCFYYYRENENSISRTYNEAKFQRIAKCLDELLKRLDLCFPVSEYMPHYQRFLLLSIRGVMFHEIFSVNNSLVDKCHVIKKRLAERVYSPLFCGFQYRLLDKKRQILYLLLKYRMAYLIILFFHIHKHISK